MPILFYGDPHGVFAPLVAACAEARPDHVVIVGDLELARPLTEELAPVLALGARCWYVLGNHDCDTEECYDFLVGDHPEGNIGGRVVEMPCREGLVRVAGLGGVYKGRIWNPRVDAEPKFRTREEFMRHCRPSNRWRGGLPLGQRDTIFPEDHRADRRADILVTHEAPSTHPFGVAVIDDLAVALGARRIVHGHLHVGYTAETRGVAVHGLDGRQTLLLPAA